MGTVGPVVTVGTVETVGSVETMGTIGPVGPGALVLLILQLWLTLLAVLVILVIQLFSNLEINLDTRTGAVAFYACAAQSLCLTHLFFLSSLKRRWAGYVCSSYSIERQLYIVLVFCGI